MTLARIMSRPKPFLLFDSENSILNSLSVKRHLYMMKTGLLFLFEEFGKLDQNQYVQKN